MFVLFREEYSSRNPQLKEKKMSQISKDVGNHDDVEYDSFLARINARFIENTKRGKDPVFTTDVVGLWDAYLDSFGPKPADGEVACAERQYHNCNACRHFVQRFGSLVTIDESGLITPAIWNEDDAPESYKPAIAAMARLVRRAKVNGVFLSSEWVWGTPKTGIWHHMAVTPPSVMVYQDRVLTAFQAIAAKTEDFKTVMRALEEFSQANLELALTLLKSEALYRSEKVLGQAEWLYNLHVAFSAVHGPAKANVVWKAIATAPAGFCHPRSSMIGTLLEDIVAGMDFGEVSKRFAAKMHPLSYQRPQAPPKAGAIDAAEKLAEKLGIGPSLARRYARLDEVQALWVPKEQKPTEPDGVFGHLKKVADAPSMKVPAQTMTWEKFQRTVLPTADRIEILAPDRDGSYTSFTTAVNSDAPPILQWDSEEQRNPVAWYFWNGGSPARQFGLQGNTYCKVNAITFKPSMWNGGNEHQGKGVAFIIDGAKDTRNNNSELFPETMRSELHGVRSVIEAYSRNAKLEGQDQQSAAGLMFGTEKNWNVKLRVWVGNNSSDYQLDRWD